MTKEFKPLSDFSNRDVEYYVSADPYNTSVYFGGRDKNADDKSSALYFELIRFGYQGGDNTFYLKYPGQDYFTELQGGIGSSRGSMGTGSATNPWADKFNDPITLFVHDKYALISFGKYSSSFNFLQLKARKINMGSDYLYRHSAEEANFNSHLLIDPMKLNYLQLPNDIKTIAYSYKVVDENTFIVVDVPVYDFKYETHTLNVFTDGKLETMKIDKFTRFRDGGTTYIEAKDSNGIKHTMFSPTSFDKTKFPSWDNKKLVEIEEDDLTGIVKLLGITLKEKEKVNE